MRRAVILTKSSSIPRKEMLCTGESLLFSQLTRRPRWLRCWSTRCLCTHTRSREWVSHRDSWGSQNQGQGTLRQFRKNVGETGTAWRGGLFTDMLGPQRQTKETVSVKAESRHENTHPSDRQLQTNPGVECKKEIASASASWKEAYAETGSRLADLH